MNRKELDQFTRISDSEVVDPEERLNTGTLGACLDEVYFHSKHRYFRFTPCPPTHSDFIDRLCAWLSSAVQTREQRAMLRLVPHIHFLDPDDILALYEAAFEGPISRWLIDEEGLDFTDPGSFDRALAEAVDQTWFCPISDSMDIAQFHHANRIAGHPHRPTWRTLRAFGDISKIREYIARHAIRRIVLLEDFVGSGNQCRPVLDFISEHFSPTTPVLFAPLVASQVGLRDLIRDYGSMQGLKIEPVSTIPVSAHVRETPSPHEPPLFSEFRALVHSTFPLVSPASQDADVATDGDAFGFGRLGALVVLCTNCPNNTLPLIWREAPEWRALFPRVDRV